MVALSNGDGCELQDLAFEQQNNHTDDNDDLFVQCGFSHVVSDYSGTKIPFDSNHK